MIKKNLIKQKKVGKKVFKVLKSWKKKFWKKKYVMDETKGVSNVDMTENRDIPDHPWT